MKDVQIIGNILYLEVNFFYDLKELLNIFEKNLKLVEKVLYAYLIWKYQRNITKLKKIN